MERYDTKKTETGVGKKKELRWVSRHRLKEGGETIKGVNGRDQGKDGRQSHEGSRTQQRTTKAGIRENLAHGGRAERTKKYGHKKKDTCQNSGDERGEEGKKQTNSLSHATTTTHAEDELWVIGGKKPKRRQVAGGQHKTKTSQTQDHRKRAETGRWGKCCGSSKRKPNRGGPWMCRATTIKKATQKWEIRGVERQKSLGHSRAVGVR